MPEMTYHDHKGSGKPQEEHNSFEILAKGGDYFISLTDELTGKSMLYRYCIDGGFEMSHPKTTRAIADLHRAFVEENK
jgi:hypothetical protein